MVSEATGTSLLTRFSALLDLVYQGSTEPSCWPRILAAAAVWIDAPKALLFTPHHNFKQGGCLYSHGFPSSMPEEWTRRFALDVWARPGVEKGAFVEGIVPTGEKLVPQQVLLTTPLCTRCDVADSLSSIVLDFNSPGILPTVFAFFWDLDAPGVSPEQTERLRLLVPHLSRSLGVMQRLREADQQVAVSQATLEVLPAGVLLFGALSQVTFANQHARRLLRDGDGLRLEACSRLSGARLLVADNAAARERLRGVLSSALRPAEETAAPFSRSVSVPRLSGRTPYALHFSNLPTRSKLGLGNDIPRAIAFLADPEHTLDIDTERLRSAYKLTHAEARTALLLASGDSLGEIARTLGVSPNTLKTQVRGLYSKTGMHDRTQFVKLMLSLATRH